MIKVNFLKCFKLFLTTVLMFFLTALFNTHQVYAHVLKTDGSIGAILHIDPDDDPVAGQSSGFFFDFKDTQNKFQPQNCNCTFSILESNKEIFSQPLFQDNQNPSLTSASLFFVFPKRDVYQVKVVGVPKSPNLFQPFTLIYNVRVDKISQVSSSPQSSSQNWLAIHTAHLIGGILIGVFLIFALIRQFSRTRV